MPLAMSRRVAFRVDASSVIGVGHARRCIALARALAQDGVECCFAMRESDIDTDRLLLEFASTRICLPQGRDALQHDYSSWLGVEPARDMVQFVDGAGGQGYDWIIVDHYAIDAEWHDGVRAQTGSKIAVIDDLANRPLSADLIIDQNWHSDHFAKYASVNLRKASILGGPHYALLDAAFLNGPKWQFSNIVKSIGVFMGGVDAANATEKVLDMLGESNFAGTIAIVTGSANPNVAKLRGRASNDQNVQLHIDLPNLAYFFAEHDLQVGAGGSATWERCCAGAPTLALVCADNQRQILCDMAEAGFPWGAELDDRDAQIESLGRACADSAARLKISSACQQLVDGNGAARVARALLLPKIRVRRAELDDARNMYKWRNDSSVRNVSRDTRVIDFDDHLRWLDSSLQMPTRLILIGELETGEPVGVVRFDGCGRQEVEVSIYLDPAWVGKGLGGPLLEAAESYLVNARNSGVDIVAFTMSGNSASEHLFIRAGYRRLATGFLKKRDK